MLMPTPAFTKFLVQKKSSTPSRFSSYYALLSQLCVSKRLNCVSTFLPPTLYAGVQLMLCRSLYTLHWVETPKVAPRKHDQREGWCKFVSDSEDFCYPNPITIVISHPRTAYQFITFYSFLNWWLLLLPRNTLESSSWSMVLIRWKVAQQTFSTVSKVLALLSLRQWSLASVIIRMNGQNVLQRGGNWKSALWGTNLENWRKLDGEGGDVGLGIYFSSTALSGGGIIIIKGVGGRWLWVRRFV